MGRQCFHLRRHFFYSKWTGLHQDKVVRVISVPEGRVILKIGPFSSLLNQLVEQTGM